jgi:hypothetical protein
MGNLSPEHKDLKKFVFSFLMFLECFHFVLNFYDVLFWSLERFRFEKMTHQYYCEIVVSVALLKYKYQ